MQTLEGKLLTNWIERKLSHDELAVLSEKCSNLRYEQGLRIRIVVGIYWKELCDAINVHSFIYTLSDDFQISYYVVEKQGFTQSFTLRREVERVERIRRIETTTKDWEGVGEMRLVIGDHKNCQIKMDNYNSNNIGCTICKVQCRKAELIKKDVVLIEDIKQLAEVIHPAFSAKLKELKAN